MLGPLLFIIYINNLPEQVRSDIFLFTDDIKIFQQIKGHDDHDILQEDINTMLSWAEKWQLEFHPDKCVSMAINRGTKTKEIYRMHNTELRQVNQEKDIGVIVDNQLKFENHVQEKIKKANNTMGLIRTFINLDEDIFLKLFKAPVRPHIEYANTTWNPTKMKNIIAIENVQRRATKYLPTLKNMTYEERLKKLNLPTLQYRRMRGDLIETYKILTGKYDRTVAQIMPQ